MRLFKKKRPTYIALNMSREHIISINRATDFTGDWSQ